MLNFGPFWPFLWVFYHEFMHFLVPLLHAQIVWWCPKIDKYQVCQSGSVVQGGQVGQVGHVGPGGP